MVKKTSNDPRTYEIIGAVMEVHKEMGSGFLEAVYQECLEIEFRMRKIPYEAQPLLKVFYKNSELRKYYIPDFIIFHEVIVEIKAERCLTKTDEAQIINSLKNSKKKIGLLINFGESSLKFKRFAN